MAYGSKGIFQLARSKPEINYTGLDEEELKDDLGIIDTHLDYLEKGLQEIKEMEEIHPGALKLFGTEEDRMGELKVDAMAMVLERCRPGRVQQILGKTKLNYFGHRRILYPSDDLKPSPEDLKIFKDIFFSFHSIARTALIIGQGRDSKGRKYICCMLGKRTRDNPAPGETLGDILKLNGSIYLFEDGTFGNTLPEEYKEEKNKEKQPKKKGFFQKIIWIERRKIMPKRKC
ncbi:MAG: hypothetical protein KKE35_05555, partial [Actinobacteria bacterium]|nr:hypothetical protein [Actinomycetota bacterium]